MATPYFDANGKPMGSIAVATPSSRLTDELHEMILSKLFAETQKITRAIGGKIPQSYQPFITSLQEQTA